MRPLYYNHQIIDVLIKYYENHIMKKQIITLVIICWTTSLSGQEIKFSITPTLNNIFHYKVVTGSASGKARIGFGTSFEYIFNRNKIIEFGLGLSYQYCPIKIVPIYDPQNINLPFTEKYSLLSLNLYSFHNFKNNFCISIGPTFDLQLNNNSTQTIDNQSGVGMSLGIGEAVKLKDYLFLNIEPKLWIHNIFPFQNEDSPFRLTVVGLNLAFIFQKHTL